MSFHKVSDIENWRLIPNTCIIDTGVNFVSINTPKDAELIFKLLQDLANHQNMTNESVFDLNRDHNDVLWVPTTKEIH